MKAEGELVHRALSRALGLLAYLGLGIVILGIPFLTAVPASNFLANPGFFDGIERGVLSQGRDRIVLCLVFYGGLLGYALLRYLKEAKAKKSLWLDSTSLAVLIYFTIYLSQVHTEWHFVNGLPPTLGAPFTQMLMPADRLAYFLVQPVSAFDDFMHGRI